MTTRGALPIGRVLPFLRWWPQVNVGSLRADLVAGLTGALIVLPQGVAFATIAGLPPQYGLYTAMVPAVVAALFGSSWHLVSGPTTAISIVVFSAISPLAEPGSAPYVSLVLTLTFLVGLMQLAMGLARLGSLVNFISHTVVIGFTAGAALLIAASQLKNFLGIDVPRGASFARTLHVVATELPHLDPHTTTVGLVTLAAGVAVRRLLPRIPYMIAAMLAGSVAGVLLSRLGGPGAAIRTVGALPGALPPLSTPSLDPAVLRQLSGNALAVSMLALTEAVSIARAIAVRSEQRIDGNQEFIGQGLANVIGSFFSSYASSGSFNRSGLNYEAGARTPLAGVFASFVLAGVLLLVAPLVAYLPVAAMAGVLFLVAWGLIDFRHIRGIVRTSPAETAILAVTFASTLLLDLEFAIYVGVVLSLVVYLNRTSRPPVRALVPDRRDPGAWRPAGAGQSECAQLKIIDVHGSLFFGAIDHVQQHLEELGERHPGQKHVLVVADGINFADVAGAELLAREARRRRRIGGGLYLVGAKERTVEVLRAGGYLDEIGAANVFPSRTGAVAAIRARLDPSTCERCSVRVFAECAEEAAQRAGAPAALQTALAAAAFAEEGDAATARALLAAEAAGAPAAVPATAPEPAARAAAGPRRRA